ncbi:ABC transporter ATP-binding protein [Brevibacillus reuszeri]|uniref:ABC transporter ATP-binding protein n=1 Tax=Brevibacillus reuszeri TaxID=54915 RepID=UPI002899A316|nr:ABC transporter ATP-binding protein [Brevibacillus reuszeri]
MIRVERVSKTFKTGWLRQQTYEAVKHVSFSIGRGETLGLIGENGCGKSTLSRLMVKLLPVDEGHIFFESTDITHYTMRQMFSLRTRMQIIFQHPDSALHPRQTMLQSLVEPLLLHKIMDKEQAVERVKEVLEPVGLTHDILSRYPHQVSGGQIQRVVIARALTLNPRFIVLDEPTSMLDVSVQAQVIEVLKTIQQQFDLTYLFISHDLDLVAHVSDRIAVMHKGEIVELDQSEKVMSDPAHPYSQKLVHAFCGYQMNG